MGSVLTCSCLASTCVVEKPILDRQTSSHCLAASAGSTWVHSQQTDWLAVDAGILVQLSSDTCKSSLHICYRNGKAVNATHCS